MDQDGNSSPSHVLLVLDIAVAREQHVPLTFSKHEELAVLFRSISGSSYRLALVAHGPDALIQLVWKAFIDEDLHFPKRAKRRVLASSNAAMACSRLTPGYCFRNSSSVSPPSKYSSRVWKGTRVPRKTGAPLGMSGPWQITL